MIILYIHGFASSSQSKKVSILKRHYSNKKGVIFIAPTLSYIPSLAITTLEDMIESYLALNQQIVLVGSSMGGFMSIYLSNKYNLKAILINPLVKIDGRFSSHIGYVKNFYDGSSFEFTKNHIDTILDYSLKDLKYRDNLLVLIQDGDEVLDYMDTYEFFIDKIDSNLLIVDSGGNHSYLNIETKFSLMDNFFYLK